MHSKLNKVCDLIFSTLCDFLKLCKVEQIRSTICTYVGNLVVRNNGMYITVSFTQVLSSSTIPREMQKCCQEKENIHVSTQYYISFIFIACKERFGSLIQNQKWLFDTLVFFSDPHELATTDMRRRGVVGKLGIKIPCLTTQYIV